MQKRSTNLHIFSFGKEKKQKKQVRQQRGRLGSLGWMAGGFVWCGRELTAACCCSVCGWSDFLLVVLDILLGLYVVAPI
jgi:hypothetical protein